MNLNSDSGLFFFWIKLIFRFLSPFSTGARIRIQKREQMKLRKTNKTKSLNQASEKCERDKEKILGSG